MENIICLLQRRFSNPIAVTPGKGEKIRLKLPKRQPINEVLVMENIVKGERIRAFVLKGKTSNGWNTIFEGSNVGHKFIHQFEEIECTEIRLVVTDSRGEADILKLSVFNSSNE